MSDEGAGGGYRNVLSPIKLGPIEVPNRVFFAPHGIALEVKSPGSDIPAEPAMNRAYYFGDRAAGGCGLIIHSTQVMPGQTNLSETPLNEGAIPAYARVAQEVHKHGGKIFAEIWYVNWIQKAWEPLGPERPAIAPVASPTLYYPGVRRQATIRELKLLTEAYRVSARNLRKAGYDGIELHVSHGSFVEYFLTPYFNKRTDEYGGSLENRARLMVELLEVCREEIGPDMALGIRINADELLQGGLDEEATKEVLRYLNEKKLCDFFDLDVSVEPEQADLMTTGMFHPALHNAERAARVAEAAGDTPVLAAPGRLTSMADAEKILASTRIDMVGLTRGLIAEPELVNKSRDGKAGERRICVAINACVDQFQVGWGCAINPVAGKENRWGREFTGPTPSPKKVVIIGGGPAGLEAARIAATRGNSVLIFEKRDRVGGQVQDWGGLPGRDPMRTLPNYFSIQLKNLGVDVRLGATATVDAVLAEKPDVVMLATGSRYDKTGVLPTSQKPLPGHDLPHVVMPEDIFAGRKLSGKVVVIDDEGYHTASGLAEKLAADGCQVVYVARKQTAGASLGLAIGKITPRLLGAGVELHTGTLATAISDAGVHLYEMLAATPKTVEGVDYVVLSTSRLPIDDLFDQIDGKVPYLYQIGDCLAPRSLRDAIYEGHRFGRVIGEPDMPEYVTDEMFKFRSDTVLVSAGG